MPMDAVIDDVDLIVREQRRRSAAVGSALASDVRLQILTALVSRPLTLAQLTREMGGKHNQSSLFRHLARLAQAGLVEKIYEQGVRYRVKDPKIVFQF